MSEVEEMKLKGGGWAVRFDGSEGAAAEIVRRIWSDETKTKHIISGGIMITHMPASDGAFTITAVPPGEYVTFYQGEYRVQKEVPREWVLVKIDDGLTPFTRRIIKEWSEYGP